MEQEIRFCALDGHRIAYATAGEGPTLLEAVTYRWKGHSKSDKNLYRTRDEIAEWQAKDPIPHFEAQVVEAGLLTTEEVAVVRDEVVATLRAAVREANSAPDADPSDLLDSVFATA